MKSQKGLTIASPSREKLIAVVLYQGVTLLDVAGPLQVLAGLRKPFRTVLVGNTLVPVATDTPLQLTPNCTFAEVPEPHVLVVPGGGLGMVKAMVCPELQTYLLSSARSATIVASVCTGSLLLASAGLLEGRRATTHWGYATLLERLGARYQQARWVEDGAFVTAAGSAAGLDMALRLVARLADEGTARQVQVALELDSRAPFELILHNDLGQELLGHLPDNEARGRLASMRLILSSRPDLLERLAL